MRMSHLPRGGSGRGDHLGHVHLQSRPRTAARRVHRCRAWRSASSISPSEPASAATCSRWAATRKRHNGQASRSTTFASLSSCWARHWLQQAACSRASRLYAVNQSSGGSDLLLMAIAGPVIAGTSLFGGRGYGMVGAARRRRHRLDRERHGPAGSRVVGEVHRHWRRTDSRGHDRSR